MIQDALIVGRNPLSPSRRALAPKAWVRCVLPFVVGCMLLGGEVSAQDIGEADRTFVVRCDRPLSEEDKEILRLGASVDVGESCRFIDAEQRLRKLHLRCVPSENHCTGENTAGRPDAFEDCAISASDRGWWMMVRFKATDRLPKVFFDLDVDIGAEVADLLGVEGGRCEADLLFGSAAPPNSVRSGDQNQPAADESTTAAEEKPRARASTSGSEPTRISPGATRSHKPPEGRPSTPVTMRPPPAPRRAEEANEVQLKTAEEDREQSTERPETSGSNRSAPEFVGSEPVVPKSRFSRTTSHAEPGDVPQSGSATSLGAGGLDDEGEGVEDATDGGSVDEDGGGDGRDGVDGVGGGSNAGRDDQEIESGEDDGPVRSPAQQDDSEQRGEGGSEPRGPDLSEDQGPGLSEDSGTLQLKLQTRNGRTAITDLAAGGRVKLGPWKDIEGRLTVELRGGPGGAARVWEIEMPRYVEVEPQSLIAFAVLKLRSSQIALFEVATDEAMGDVLFFRIPELDLHDVLSAASRIDAEPEVRWRHVSPRPGPLDVLLLPLLLVPLLVVLRLKARRTLGRRPGNSRVRVYSGETAFLRKQVGRMRQESDDLRSKLTDLEAQHMSLQEKYRSVRHVEEDRAAANESSALASREPATGGRPRNPKAKADSGRSYRGETSFLRKQVADLQRELADLQSSRGELKTEHELLQKKYHDTLNALEQALTDRADAKETLTLENDLERAQLELDRARRELDMLRGQLTVSRAQTSEAIQILQGAHQQQAEWLERVQERNDGVVGRTQRETQKSRQDGRLDEGDE